MALASLHPWSERTRPRERIGVSITPTSTVEREALAISINCFCLSFILMSAGARRKIWFQSSLGSREASGIVPRVRRRWCRSGGRSFAERPHAHAMP